MDNLFLILLLMGIGATLVFLILGIVKKNKGYFKKTGIAVIVVFVSFIGFGISTDNIEEEQKIENKQEEEQEEAKEEEEPEYEIIDDVAVFTDYSDFGKAKTHKKNFSTSMTRSLNDNHNDIENGAIFRSGRTLTDQKGNETKTNIIVVWYSQDTIDSINYDNWPIAVGTDLYDTASAVWFHPIVRGEDNKNIVNENVPAIYTKYQGTEYEE